MTTLAYLQQLAAGPHRLVVRPDDHLLLQHGRRSITVGQLKIAGKSFVRAPSGDECWLTSAELGGLRKLVNAARAVRPVAKPKFSTPRPQSSAPRTVATETPMVNENTQRAAAKLREALKILEDGPENAPRARRLIKQAFDALGPADDDDDIERKAARSRGTKAEQKMALISACERMARSADTELAAEALARLDRLAPQRAAALRMQRERMGLSVPSAAAPIRVERDTFVISAAALAQSKTNGRTAQ